MNQIGPSEKVLRAGVRLLHKGAPTSSSLVPPKPNLFAAITPVSNVVWVVLFGNT